LSALNIENYSKTPTIFLRGFFYMEVLMRKIVLMIGAVLAIGMSAQAAGKGNKPSLHDQFTGQGYGTAGCGLGSVVFGQQPGKVQVLASTTNAWGGQTFAMSSGTSNCSNAFNGHAAAEFIKVNKMALEKDIARGQGETLASLGQVMDCQNPQFASNMKKQYSQQFPQGGATEGQLEDVANQSCQN
jgi:hypothetical protein